MSDVLTEITASLVPVFARPFTLALCMGEGGIDDKAWWRCYGDKVGGPVSYTGSLDAVFNSANKLWPGKNNSHALGPGQFQPATYEEAAARTGLPTLAPQSQLANLYNHLQYVYALKGGNFEADLASGKQATIAEALPVTWTSLGDAAGFAEHYAKALTMLATPAPVVPLPPPVPGPIIPVPQPPDLDPEIRAISDMIDILQGLPTDGRKRVVVYVTARFVE